MVSIRDQPLVRLLMAFANHHICWNTFEWKEMTLTIANKYSGISKPIRNDTPREVLQCTRDCVMPMWLVAVKRMSNAPNYNPDAIFCEVVPDKREKRRSGSSASTSATKAKQCARSGIKLQYCAAEAVP